MEVTGVLSAMKSIYAKDGPKGFIRGFGITFVGIVYRTRISWLDTRQRSALSDLLGWSTCSIHEWESTIKL